LRISIHIRNQFRVRVREPGGDTFVETKPGVK
jgi:hypothetical protein